MIKKEPKPGIVKIIRWGKWSLIHDRRLDEWGMLFDAFELREHKLYGDSLIRPFLPILKVETYTKSDPIANRCTDYTDKEYESMLAEEIRRIEDIHRRLKVA